MTDPKGEDNDLCSRKKKWNRKQWITNKAYYQEQYMSWGWSMTCVGDGGKHTSLSYKGLCLLLASKCHSIAFLGDIHNDTEA